MENLKKDVKKIIKKETAGMNKEEKKRWFSELSTYGCSQGAVTSLIYYSQTEAFALKHFKAIAELMGEVGMCTLDLNAIAWFGFEAVASSLEGDLC